MYHYKIIKSDNKVGLYFCARWRAEIRENGNYMTKTLDVKNKTFTYPYLRGHNEIYSTKRNIIRQIKLLDKEKKTISYLE